MAKQKLISLTAKDFKWDYYRGGGKGGQKKNKTSNCVRCTHPPTGISAYSENGRSQWHNKLDAFHKVVNNPKFRQWLRIESLKKAGLLDQIETEVDSEMKKIKVELKEEGKWIEKDVESN